MKCRHCGEDLTLPFVDLGSAPPSNAYLTSETLHAPEKWYPLRVLTCTKCWLVQTEDYADCSEFFAADYAYFSSFSTTWLKHAERYVADMVERFELEANSHVVEIASNDGYLLQYVKARGIRCLGIEPTSNTAKAAANKGIEVIGEFFGSELARHLVATGRSADLMVANNVLAHVPDINDFVTGFSTLLKTNGVATFEFPHLLKLVQRNQFDTIYHEHYSYLSLVAAHHIFERNGLTIFDAEEIPTHGGSLRIFAQRSDTGPHEVTDRTNALREAEISAGMTTPSFYSSVQTSFDRLKNDFLAFLIDAKNAGKKVAAYGAAAKGNTLMNYAGIRPDLIRFVVDRNPAKRGKYMPGSRIPIVSEDRLEQEKPDYVVIIPWNIEAEIARQLAYIKEWGGQFVIAIPEPRIFQA